MGAAVAGQLDQMVKRRHPSSEGMTDRRQVSRPPRSHTHILLEQMFDYQCFSGSWTDGI
jgi:hypothetical protein